MKTILFLFVLLVFGFSCKKEKIDVPEIIGKWQFYRFAPIFSKSKFNDVRVLGFDPSTQFIIPFGYDYSKFGDVTLELSEKGGFKFTSYAGTEKFRVIGKEMITIKYAQNYDLNGWNFKLKNKKGQRFEFKVFYDSVNNCLYTVPWIKGTVYNTFDEPFSWKTSVKVLDVPLSLESYTVEDYTYQEYEYLGYFKKL